jgi:hypothetical protein
MYIQSLFVVHILSHAQNGVLINRHTLPSAKAKSILVPEISMAGWGKVKPWVLNLNS